MATAVFLHAHPDDEAIATGGTMRVLADAGHRVVLVSATRGEVGEPVDGVLAEGEELGDRRVAELEQAGEILGASRVAFLGYRDSGMMGERTNRRPDAFWMADLDEAERRFRAILDEESAALVVCYDPHGGYGHPDHIQVHRVGTVAARRAGGVPVVWASMNATRIREQIARSRELDLGDDQEVRRDTVDNGPFGMEEDELTHAIDVSHVIDVKRRAMAIHASQISDDSFFMKMPEELFGGAFGTEFYCDPARPRDGEPLRTDFSEYLS